MTDATEINFDGWTVRADSGELVREGRTQRLPQQPLRVLLELLAHPGEVVTRERLVQLLWPKGVVDFDNNLNSIVRKLRVALKDDSETPRYVETLRHRLSVHRNAAVDPGCRKPPAPLGDCGGRRSRVIAGAFAWWQLNRTSPAQQPSASQTADGGRRSNQRAYQFYLDGKFHRSRRDVNGNPQAIASFQAALREDPYFADAWAALSETFTRVAEPSST